MRPFAIVLGSALAAAAVTRAQDVPEGVRYATASREINEAAEAALRGGLSGAPRAIAALGNDGARPLLTGLFLSRTLLDTGLVQSGEFGKGVYKMPLSKDVKPQAPGLVARDVKERAVLDAALERWLPASRNVGIRRLTADELALIWYYIAWDISEPIFAVEIGGRTLVVDFDEAGRAVTWLEDISQPCFRLAWEGGGLKDCFCSHVVADGTRRRVMFRRLPGGDRGCSGGTTNAP
jgi:hypothetical protein